MGVAEVAFAGGFGVGRVDGTCGGVVEVVGVEQLMGRVLGQGEFMLFQLFQVIFPVIASCSDVEVVFLVLRVFYMKTTLGT